MDTNCIITFFDIMGFKEIINNNDKMKVLEILKEFRFQGEKIESPVYKGQKRTDYRYFSDCVVRMTEFENVEAVPDLLLDEFLDVLYAQRNMIKRQNVFIRGGITIGNIFFDDTYFFGKGFNEAYEIEHSLAKWPRILLDKDVLAEYLKPQIILDKKWFGLFEKILYKTEDGRAFLNYAADMSCGRNIKDYIEFLKVHKRLAVENLLKYKNDLGVSYKYIPQFNRIVQHS